MVAAGEATRPRARKFSVENFLLSSPARTSQTAHGSPALAFSSLAGAAKKLLPTFLLAVWYDVGTILQSC